MTSIFLYEDYRKFLREWLANRPRRGRGMLRSWAELLRVSSSTLSQILSGLRELSLEQAHDLQLTLGMSEGEADYFSLLVARERASSRNLKNHLDTKLKRLRQESQNLIRRVDHERRLTESESAIYYSSWLYTAVWLATSIPDFQTIDAITELLGVERERIVAVLNFLKSTELVEENLGHFSSRPQRTHLERNSPFIARHHSHWRLQAIRRTENLKDDELMFTGPLSISRKDFAQVREKIVALIQAVSETVNETVPEDIAVFQVDWFWLHHFKRT